MNKIPQIIAFALIIFLSSTLCISAQNFTIKGIVVNAETSAGVEFANIGVEGTYLGTATDMDGNFEIKLSNSLLDKTIIVSAVGYQAKKFKVAEWKSSSNIKVSMMPTNYSISEVSVQTKSKIGNGIIKAATNLIRDNYINTPYGYLCYLQTSDVNGTNEALVKISDAKGYGNRSFVEGFKDINYTIAENNSQKQALTLSEGLTNIDNLLAQDIVRQAGNILSTEVINDFDINVAGKESINGDSAWVLTYNCLKPNINTTGMPEAVAYKGTIYISEKDNSVLKNSVEIEKNGSFKHGDSFYNSAKSSEKINLKIETNYKKTDKNYILDSVNYTQEDSKGNKTSSLLKVVEVTNFDSNIKSRQYFNGDDVNKAFWNDFKRP